MAEITFDKAYQPDAPQSTFTRVANRLLKVFNSAVGYLPDEVKGIADKIKQQADADDYEYEHSYECNGTNGAYDTVRYSSEHRVRAFWDIDEYGDHVYRVTWYFRESSWYKKRIGEKLLVANSYLDIVRKSVLAKGKYRYFCVHRPPTRGGIPDGFVSYDVYGDGAGYCGEATYNTELTDAELSNYGLIPDDDWERIRAGYAEV